MNTEQVRLAAQPWVEGGAERYLVAIGPETDFAGHIRMFEAGIAQLVEAAHQLNRKVALALALPFTPILERAPFSYRRALKKYTHAPLFTDLNIFLILVREDNRVQVLDPAKINAFLKELDRLIIREKSL